MDRLDTVTALVGSDLAGALERWLDEDPDPATRAEVERLIAAGDAVGLSDRFGTRLAFGTAGLRGEIGAGPNRMNRLVVRQAAAGLMTHLGAGARVVVGHDARHGSAEFAADTAAVVAAAGGTALCLPGRLPTPLVPFAVRHLGADAGVMVTASHNPPRDNGYKVYLDDGAQLVPPLDAAIAAHIDTAAATPVVLAPAGDEGIVHLGADVVEAYLEVVDGCRLVPEVSGVSVAYTPLHGVGRDLIVTAFDRVGYPPPLCIAEQADPDPDFPTVAFPNPEEPGALDLAMAHADAAGLDLILANDPDADRLGIAVRSSDGWRVLTGNEIGVLLADHVLRHTVGDDRLVVTTMVSSQMLGAMARAAGVRYAETLTGFKWIMRPALDDPSLRLVFAYEEALGYAVSDRVRDKDGITAAVLFVELVGDLAADGRTVLDRLDELASEHGLHVSDTWAIRFDGLDSADRMAAVMAQVRTDAPTRMAGLEVTRVHDYLSGGELAPTDAVLVEMGSTARVVVRPSGTEPKVKCYLEVTSPVLGTDVTGARQAAGDRLAALRADLAAHLGLTTHH